MVSDEEQLCSGVHRLRPQLVEDEGAGQGSLVDDKQLTRPKRPPLLFVLKRGVSGVDAPYGCAVASSCRGRPTLIEASEYADALDTARAGGFVQPLGGV